MMQNLMRISLIVAVISSCTFRTSIEFNADWSGNLEYYLDMSMMAGAMSDTTGFVSLESETDEEGDFSLMDYEKIEGVSNVKLEEDLVNGIYSFSFDFANLDVLNRVLSNENPLDDFGIDPETNTSGSPMSFELNKNTLLINMMDFEPILKLNEENESSGASMLNYELNIAFKRDIKKFKTDGKTIQSGSREINLIMNLDKIDQEFVDTDQNIKIVFD